MASRAGVIGWAVGYLLATPRYHHWHHRADRVDVNFAVHLPLIVALFGTFYLPGALWPTTYGTRDNPVPDGYWAQRALPFRRSSAPG